MGIGIPPLEERRRFAPVEMREGEWWRLLWEEVRDGTFVWRDPTASERIEAENRRTKLFQDSRVPWIVNDIGGLAGFVDDIQDVVSFSRWNKKLIAPDMQLPFGKGNPARFSGASELASRTCNAGRYPSKRAVAGAGAGWRSLGLGLPLALLFRFLPFPPPVMWGLLAGQVALGLFGVGLSLGPIVGASLEVTFRGLDALGFPFGADRNKAHQLKRARVLQGLGKLYGASAYMSNDDRLTLAMGTELLARDFEPLPPIVIPPSEYPDAGELLRDPYDTVAGASRLAGSLLPNAISYVVNDLMTPALSALSRWLGGDGQEPQTEQAPPIKAALRNLHISPCPRLGHCQKAYEDSLRYLDLFYATGLPKEAERLQALLYRGLYGGLYSDILVSRL